MKNALDRQLIELTGSAEERATLRKQQEKEERVEMLRRQMIRRTKNRELFNGWSAWTEHWKAGRYAHDRLREVANRFRSPSLSGAFFFWARTSEQARVTNDVTKRLGAQSAESEQLLRIEASQAKPLGPVRVSAGCRRCCSRPSISPLCSIPPLSVGEAGK